MNNTPTLLLARGKGEPPDGPKSSHPAPAQAAAPAAQTQSAEPDAQFLNEARLRRVPLAFHLRGGQCITGTVRSFGRYSVEVQNATVGRVLIEKHAIDFVEIIAPPAPGPLRPAIAK